MRAWGAGCKGRDSIERLTRPGAVIGSPGYMAPEQARGEEAGQRADVELIDFGLARLEPTGFGWT